jgi:hypothetical protein
MSATDHIDPRPTGIRPRHYHSNRRLARDFERYATAVAAFIRLAMISLMLRRLNRSTPSMESHFLDRL